MVRVTRVRVRVTMVRVRVTRIRVRVSIGKGYISRTLKTSTRNK